jgi:hypothetical protein
MPNKNAWLTYSRWGRKYGKCFPNLIGSADYNFGMIDSDIVHAEFLGTHVIVLNSAKAVHELFEKRSSIYSDRYGRCSPIIPHDADQGQTPTAFPDPFVSARGPTF